MDKCCAKISNADQKSACTSVTGQKNDSTCNSEYGAFQSLAGGSCE
jgi:hypothetical protein